MNIPTMVFSTVLYVIVRRISPTQSSLITDIGSNDVGSNDKRSNDKESKTPQTVKRQMVKRQTVK